LSVFGRYSWVRQNDETDCGASALATLARYYHRPLSVEQLRDLAGTDRVGTNLMGLLQAAEQLGFSAKAVKGTNETLGRVPVPAIAHVLAAEGRGHFVVLYRVRHDSVILADPARGIRRLTREEFIRDWTGYLLLAVPDQLPVRGGTLPSPTRRFVGLLAGHTSVLVEAFVCALLMTVLGAATAFLVQHLVDTVLARQEGRLLDALSFGVLLALAFRTVFGILRQYLLAHVGRAVDLALVAGYSRHLLRLPLRFFESRQVGEVVSRINDASKVCEAVSGTTTTALVDGTVVVILLGGLWLYDWPLALAVTGFVPLQMLTAAAHHPLVRRRSRAVMEQAAGFSAHLVEDVSGVETVKAFGSERRRAEGGEERLVRLTRSSFALQKLGLSMDAAGAFLTALAGLVVLWYGGHRAMGGAMTVGQLLFCYALVGYLLEPLNRLTSVNLKLQDALVAVDRLYQVFDLKLEQAGGGPRARFHGVHEAIELRDVTFQYGCRGKVLDGLNLRFPAGRTVAILGESGSGKSTLLKLLLGFYAPTDGRVLVDGVDLRDLDLGSVRGRIGLVAQDPFIFNGSIRDNIAFGRPGAALDDVVAAARAAGLEEFITGLPDRYESPIGERGANMSGGQRQRLAIARALLREPDVLIFDEATSHLDTATERAIQQSLRTALAGKTVILVAHRLSTIRDADYVYVLHQGRVVEEGVPRQLLAQSGWYAALWQAQTEDGDRAAAGPSRLNGKAKREGVGHA
jgi:ATP-binding cassette, subfamily C, bacteriocin exporter